MAQNNMSSAQISDIFTWKWEYVALFWAIHLVAVEILQHAIVMNVGKVQPRKIDIRGGHLDELASKDKAFIVFNRLCVPLLTYTLMRFCWLNTNHVEWDLNKLTIWNTIGSMILFFAAYDFVYVLFHRLLHVRALYPYVHKHHHRQHSPTRGNVDAVNVHPFEFLSGEFLHLFVVMAVPCHALTVLIFIAVGGVAASLNHTRFDVRIPYLYEVRAHDVHHRLPQTNYGQYTMFWDKLWGSFRPYDTKSGAQQVVIHDHED